MVSRAKASVALVALLLILLPVLAVLQYRWIGEVSAAERERLENSLRMASDRLADDFTSEISRLSNAFQIREGFPEDSSFFFDRYSTWVETTSYAHLVHEIHVLKTYPDKSPDEFKVDLESGVLQSVNASGTVLIVRDRFRPGIIPWVPGSLTLMVPILRPAPPRPFGGPPPDLTAPPRDGPRRGPEPFERRRGGPPPNAGIMDGMIIIMLDRNVILKEIIPALVQRHFSTHDEADYRIAVATTGEKPEVLYSSEGSWSPQDIAKPDASTTLVGGGPTGPPPGGGPPDIRGRRGGGRGPGPNPFLRFEPINGSGSTNGRWVLLVKHRLGSLETAVEQLRRRNLAVAFGILVVLGAGMTTVALSSQRARKLGKLQMEFAAGVSHELRTPLAVIRSAAHNLKTGVVRGKEEVEQYAAIVQDEARRLSEMVDEVLLYSETQSGRRKYELTAVDVNDVIDRAIGNLSPSIDPEKFDLTTNIDPHLPPALADPAALTQCVQNLLSNAFKYGKNGDTAHIEIAAHQDSTLREIRLSVIDHGPGVDGADRRHLFEPFYRGVRVGSNVPGNGLGLHLVQRMMRAQGGRVTFSSPPEWGACFTLHIPAAT